MIDLTTEKPIRLEEAARLVPPSRGARHTHASTILRWILRGTRGPDGERVRLEALRAGNKWITTAEAVQRFFERLTPTLEADQARLLPRSPTARRRASERAGRKLERLGI